MLLFDEITANLDAETERAVLSALKRVAENRTVISISHRTSAELWWHHRSDRLSTPTHKRRAAKDPLFRLLYV